VVAFDFRRSLIWRSVVFALACGALAVLLATAVDGAVVWRCIGALVLAFSAAGSARFAVQALRHAAICVDGAGIEFFGERRLPWTAIDSWSIVAEEGGHTLVLVLNDDATRMLKTRWMSPRRVRRYWNAVARRGRVELSVGFLLSSPAQLAPAIHRFAPRAVTTQRPT
jgi:hypothetical protein